MEDLAEIRRLHRAEGMPIKAIVEAGVGRNTVRRAGFWLKGPPVYRRRGAGSVVDAAEPAIQGVAGGLADDARHGDR